MTSPIPFCDTHPGKVINRAKIDVGTSASFERVKADTPKHAQTELRTDRIAFYIIDGCE